MIQEIRMPREAKDRLATKNAWRKLPLHRDIQSLFLGISAFSKREKEIIKAEEGFYSVVVNEQKGDNIASKLASELDILIFDSKNQKTYKATIGPSV
ncbi:MAG: hypothetical protein Q4G61_05835 [Tissierellia bacterium]|nr:hypothetical protein [Tissierellia bacterium]